MNKVNITLITPSNNKIYISTDNIKPTTINATFNLPKKSSHIEFPETGFKMYNKNENQSNWLKIIKLICNELNKIDSDAEHCIDIIQLKHYYHQNQ